MAVLAGMSFDNAVSYIYETLKDVSKTMRSGLAPVTPDDVQLAMVLVWLLEVSSERILRPGIVWMTDYIESELQTSKTYGLIVPITICALAIVLIGCALVPAFLARGEDVHWFLHLLLFCDPDTVLGSKQFFKILSNDAGGFSESDLEESSHIYEKMCAASPHPMIMMDNSLIIRSLNSAAAMLFGQEPAELLGRHMLHVFQPSSTSALASFAHSISEACYELRTPRLECDICINTQDGSHDVHASLVAVNSRGELQTAPTLSSRIAIFCLRLSNFPQVELTRIALKQQESKVNSLLSALLPAPVLERRRNQEDGIYYAVPTAVFLYVELLPSPEWYETTIFATVNALFGEFDAVIAQCSEMVRLKALNGIYIAAAGIFAEVNQPEVCAKQAVLAALQLRYVFDSYTYNSQVNMKAAISVCLKEKVVGAMIDLEMPTFEVLGTPYEALYEIARKGDSAHVMISAGVYELVYGPNYLIREGPKVDGHGRSIQTYIVKAAED
jgi:PAS domain S-box-containing protein